MTFENDNITVFLRVMQGCNLNCAHCFTLGNKDPVKQTPLEYIDTFLTKISKNVQPKRGTIYLHGGETFLADIDYLNKVIDLIDSNFDRSNFGIIPQTNLIYTLTPEIIEFIKEKCDGHLGVSWDPKIRFGSIKQEHEIKQERLFFNNLKTLIDSGIKIHISITVQKYLLQVKPQRIAELFAGVNSIDFEHLTIFDDKTKHLKVNLLQWSNWLNELVDIYINNDVSWCLPQIDLFTKSIKEGLTYKCKCDCCQRKTFTLNPNGTIGLCPDDSYISPISNVEEFQNNWSSFEKKVETAHIDKILSMSTDNCFSCEHFNECGGNCEDYFFDDSGECPLSKKVISRIKDNLDYFHEVLENKAKFNLLEFSKKGN